MLATRSLGLIGALAVLVLLASACGASSSASPQGSSSVGDPTADKLAEILARGTLVLATDLAYPPQSYRVPGAKRLANTKCTPDQMTGNQMAGYDADTSKLVARALHRTVLPGSHVESDDQRRLGDRWDIAIASMGISRERMKGLY